MTPLMRCLLIPFVLLMISAPWFFLGTETTVAGLPLWVVVTLAVALAYAATVAVLIHRHWQDLEK